VHDKSFVPDIMTVGNASGNIISREKRRRTACKRRVSLLVAFDHQTTNAAFGHKRLGIIFRLIVIQAIKQLTLTKQPLTVTLLHTQPFKGPLSGTTQVGWYQKKHSPTHTYPDHQIFFINLTVTHTHAHARTHAHTHTPI